MDLGGRSQQGSESGAGDNSGVTQPDLVQVVLDEGGRKALVDVVNPRPVRAREVVRRGRITNMVTDEVDLGTAGLVTREVVDHPGAVGVLVLDDFGRVLVIQQYRHPAGRDMWEVPAGLLDVPDEPALVAAQRELYEEADLRADHWHVLVDLYASPGGSTEVLRIFLARGITTIPAGGGFERSEEERDMLRGWVALDDVVGQVLVGRVHNPTLVAGALAAQAARAVGWSTLRPADADWPERRTTRLADQEV